MATDLSPVELPTPSPASRVVAVVLRATVRKIGFAVPANRLGARLVRAGMFVGLRTCMPAFGIKRTLVRTSLDGAPVVGEWVTGPAAPGQPIVYYLHGSGYFSCSPATHRGLIARVARIVGGPAFALRYRLAPEHRFPAAQDDALAGYRWLIAQGFTGSDIVVAGDSAGGHVALGLAHELEQRGLPLPRALVLFSPVIDPTLTRSAAADRVINDPYVAPETARRLMGMYLVGADLSDPRLDVMQLAGTLPPTLIHAGGLEMLTVDTQRFADADRAAGGACEFRVWPGQIHVFQAGYLAVPEAREALEDVRRFLDELPRDPEPAGVDS